MPNRRQALRGLLGVGAMTSIEPVQALSLWDKELYWEEIRKSFPVTSNEINLLNTGGGSVPKAALEQISKYQTIAAGGGEYDNPILANIKESGSSFPLRKSMADQFGCGPNEIALMRNAMEGLAIGLLGMDLKNGDEIVTTKADYDSCIRIIQQREKRDGNRLKLIHIPMPAVEETSVVEAFEAACGPKTKMILMCHMYNKNGQILPVKRISEMARKKGIITVVDGAQSIGQIDFKISDLGCDVFAASLHKWFWGPRGTGILYIRSEMIERFWPIWASWSGKSKDNIEKFEDYGTVSKAISVGLDTVFKFNKTIGTINKENRLRYLRDYWLNHILKSGRVSLLTNINQDYSCAITAFKVDGIDPDDIAKTIYKKHQIVIGSIHIKDKPTFTGNYIAADLTNSLVHLDRLNEAFNAVLKL